MEWGELLLNWCRTIYVDNKLTKVAEAKYLLHLSNNAYCFVHGSEGGDCWFSLLLMGGEQKWEINIKPIVKISALASLSPPVRAAARPFCCINSHSSMLSLCVAPVRWGENNVVLNKTVPLNTMLVCSSSVILVPGFGLFARNMSFSPRRWTNCVERETSFDWIVQKRTFLGLRLQFLLNICCLSRLQHGAQLTRCQKNACFTVGYRSGQTTSTYLRLHWPIPFKIPKSSRCVTCASSTPEQTCSLTSSGAFM